MEQNIDWASVEAQISESEIESLRGDKEFIAFVKQQIKQRVKDTKVFYRTWKVWTSEATRGVEHTVPYFEDVKTPFVTCTGFMRHIFLAYGWLRYKPFTFVEPNTKVVKSDWWRIPFEKSDWWRIPLEGEGYKSYYSSAKSPCAQGIITTVRWLREQHEKSTRGGDDLRTIVIVREDLSRSQQIVQAGHALAELVYHAASDGHSTMEQWVEEDKTLIVLGAKDLQHLEDIHGYVKDRFEFRAFHEPDRGGEMTALAIYPGTAGDLDPHFASMRLA